MSIDIGTDGKDLVLDPFSKLTMTYSADGFKELVRDIDKQGQLVPIILREGNILDGRHRYKACKDLGIEVRCVDLGVISDEEALNTVISNSINKATGTDASKVEAYLMCNARGMKQKDMSSVFSRLNTDYTRKLAYIEKNNPQYLQVLLRQNSVRLYNKEFNKIEDYGTINGIWRTLKGNNKLENELVEVEPESAETVSYDIYIDQIMPTVAAEQEFWNVYETAKLGGTPFSPSSSLGKIIIDYVIGKHKTGDES